MKRKKERKSDDLIFDAVIQEHEETTLSPEIFNPLFESCGGENLEQMIADFNPEYQDPSMVLKIPVPSEVYRITARSIEPVAIEHLKPIEQINDFADESEATMPLVVHTNEGYFLMDGRSLVEHAIAAGQTSLECEVDSLATHDMTELCLKKAGIRSQTRGGRARYAELARNTYELELRLLAENSDLRTFAHGGRRTGEAFVGDRTVDVRTVLAERMSKSKNSINGYISHAKYISDDAMTQLIQCNMDKAFFEKFGRLKTKLVERLQEQRRTQDEITADVSALILRCANEGFPEPIQTHPQPQAQVVQSAPQEDVPESEDDELVGEDKSDEQIPASTESGKNPVDSMKRSSLEVSSRLFQRIEGANDAADLYTVLIEEIRELNELVSRIAGMANPDLKEEQRAA